VIRLTALRIPTLWNLLLSDDKLEKEHQ
jgi:hypothetical protein